MCITTTLLPNNSRAAGGTPMLYSLKCLLYSNPLCRANHSNTAAQVIKCNCFNLQCCVFDECWHKWQKANKSLNPLNAKTPKWFLYCKSLLMQLFHVDLIMIQPSPLNLVRHRCDTGSQPASEVVFREHPCSATVPCLPLCLSSSDSRTEHCCQGYHLLILVHNFEPHHQAAEWPMAETGTECPETHSDTHARKHTHTYTHMALCAIHVYCEWVHL